MAALADFIARIELKVTEQLHAQRVAYLLGAGSSYLDGNGYPLASELWNAIKARIKETIHRNEIQAKLDSGAVGLEQALDQLDDGSSTTPRHRHSAARSFRQ